MIIPIEKLPGLHPITLAYLREFSTVASFFAGNYQDENNFQRVADNVIKSDHANREELCNILLSQNTLFQCNHSAIENIKKLSHSDTLVVATGQQVGLFSGPLYTIYKAATVIRLADELTKRLKTHVVPVFYLVAEDHDFAEVQWTGVIDNANHFSKIIYAPSQQFNRLPVCRIKIDQNIQIVFDQLRQCLPQTDFKNDILQNLYDAYREGRFFHHAFALWVAKVFSKHGIVLFDASDPHIKPMIQKIFELELINNLCTFSVEQANHKLKQMHFSPQIEMIPDRPQVAILKEGRHSLQRKGQKFVNLQNNEIITGDELLSCPEWLSPKAALRPLVQDFLFPTVAYVGGPAEIAYWGQLKQAYQAYNITMPVVVPRSGFTLVENKIQKYLKRFSTSSVQYIIDPEAAVGLIHREQTPEDIRIIFEQLYSNMDVSWRALQKAAGNIDTDLDRRIEKTKNNCLHHVSLMEQNIAKTVQQKNQILSRQLDAVNNHLVPEGILQERQLNIVNYLVRYHWSVMDRIISETNPFEFKHKILEL